MAPPVQPDRRYRSRHRLQGRASADRTTAALSGTARAVVCGRSRGAASTTTAPQWHVEQRAAPAAARCPPPTTFHHRSLPGGLTPPARTKFPRAGQLREQHHVLPRPILRQRWPRLLRRTRSAPPRRRRPAPPKAQSFFGVGRSPSSELGAVLLRVGLQEGAWVGGSAPPPAPVESPRRRQLLQHTSSSVVATVAASAFTAAAAPA